MLHSSEFKAQLHALFSVSIPDGEALAILNERFSAFGEIYSVNRFPSADTPGKRCFLILFKDVADAARVSNRCKLRSFAFNGVLVELALAAKNTAYS